MWKLLFFFPAVYTNISYRREGCVTEEVKNPGNAETGRVSTAGRGNSQTTAELTLAVSVYTFKLT